MTTPVVKPKTVTQTVADLIANYQREATGPGPIWAGAAQSIVRILQSHPPEEAVATLRNLRRQCRKMSVSCFFAGAANDLALAIRLERKAHQPGGPKTAADMAMLIASGTPQLDDDGKVIEKIATCGTCGRSWNDAMITSVTPAPSARCPFEYWHKTNQTKPAAVKQAQFTDLQTSVLAQLRAAGCDFVAEATERHWKRGESYYIDSRVNVSKRLRAAFNRANPEVK